MSSRASFPEGYHYTQDHMWVSPPSKEGFVIVGVTEYPLKKLGSISKVTLGVEVGNELKRSERYGTITSARGEIDLLSPIDGIVAFNRPDQLTDPLNPALRKDPRFMNRYPYTTGFVMAMLPIKEVVRGLMDTESYKEFLTSLKG